jgi:hypothetical protein
MTIHKKFAGTAFAVALILIIASVDALLDSSRTITNSGTIMTGRLSAVVSILYSTPEAKEWLSDPGKAYIEAYFMFPPDLAEDVLFGLDLEFWEGKQNYVYNSSLAWMGTAFISRGGLLGINSGGKDYRQGGIGILANVTLQPNTWYKLSEELDFAGRKYLSFNVTGVDVNKTINLRDYDIDISDESLKGTFPGPALTFYTGACKTSLKEGGNIVYSDSVEARIETGTGYKTVLKDGFEGQNELISWDFDHDGDIDMDDVRLASNVTNWNEGSWYQEHPTSLTSIVAGPVFEGIHACKHDASPFNPNEDRYGR